MLDGESHRNCSSEPSPGCVHRAPGGRRPGGHLCGRSTGISGSLQQTDPHAYTALRGKPLQSDTYALGVPGVPTSRSVDVRAVHLSVASRGFPFRDRTGPAPGGIGAIGADLPGKCDEERLDVGAQLPVPEQRPPAVHYASEHTGGDTERRLANNGLEHSRDGVQSGHDRQPGLRSGDGTVCKQRSPLCHDRLWWTRTDTSTESALEGIGTLYRVAPDTRMFVADACTFFMSVDYPTMLRAPMADRILFTSRVCVLMRRCIREFNQGAWVTCAPLHPRPAMQMLKALQAAAEDTNRVHSRATLMLPQPTVPVQQGHITPEWSFVPVSWQSSGLEPVVLARETTTFAVYANTVRFTRALRDLVLMGIISAYRLDLRDNGDGTELVCYAAPREWGHMFVGLAIQLQCAERCAYDGPQSDCMTSIMHAVIWRRELPVFLQDNRTHLRILDASVLWLRKSPVGMQYKTGASVTDSELRSAVHSARAQVRLMVQALPGSRLSKKQLHIAPEVACVFYTSRMAIRHPLVYPKCSVFVAGPLQQSSDQLYLSAAVELCLCPLDSGQQRVLTSNNIYRTEEPLRLFPEESCRVADMDMRFELRLCALAISKQTRLGTRPVQRYVDRVRTRILLRKQLALTERSHAAPLCFHTEPRSAEEVRHWLGMMHESRAPGSSVSEFMLGMPASELDVQKLVLLICDRDPESREISAMAACIMCSERYSVTGLAAGAHVLCRSFVENTDYRVRRTLASALGRVAQAACDTGPVTPNLVMCHRAMQAVCLVGFYEPKYHSAGCAEPGGPCAAALRAVADVVAAERKSDRRYQVSFFAVTDCDHKDPVVFEAVYRALDRLAHGHISHLGRLLQQFRPGQSTRDMLYAVWPLPHLLARLHSTSPFKAYVVQKLSATLDAFARAHPRDEAAAFVAMARRHCGAVLGVTVHVARSNRQKY